MKKIKKIMAMLLAMVMVLGMTVTASADPDTGSVPSANDKGNVTITNVKKEDTVTIYTIATPKYNVDGNPGFYGFESVKKIDGNAPAIANLEKPTTAEIAELALRSDLTKAGTTVANNDTVTFDNLSVGMYLVKVTAKDPLTVYNPMIVSVNYKVQSEDGSNNNVVNGTVDANSKWEIDGETAYAKSTHNDPGLDKNIVDNQGTIIVNGNSAGKGDAVAKGDTVNYKISGTVPSYNKDYFKNPKYVITDTLSSGLDFADGTKEKIEKQISTKYKEIIEKDANATVTVNIVERVMTITFSKEMIHAIADNDALRKFEFTYSAVLNGTSVEFEPSTNTVKVDYSKTPDSDTSSGDKTTNHYTFKFNGEVKKVDENSKALSGAKFALFTDAECTTRATYGDGNPIPEQESTDKGFFDFTGLDATTYYLKETVAPKGYQLSNVVFKIEITPDFDTDGKLTQYTVSVQDITNTNQPVKITTYKPSGDGKTAVAIGAKNITEIMNTKLSSLPSTGGIGTTIFTIGGCAIMVAAAGLFFASRRKANK